MFTICEPCPGNRNATRPSAANGRSDAVDAAGIVHALARCRREALACGRASRADPRASRRRARASSARAARARETRARARWASASSAAASARAPRARASSASSAASSSARLPRHSSSSPGQRGIAASASLAVGARVLLEHDVEVGAAEAERADAGSARMLRAARQPRARLAVDVERALGEVEPSGSARSTPIVGGSTRWCSASAALTMPGDAGRRLGVADHRLDRADGAPLPAASECSAKTVLSALISAPSPATVPVPCASTRPTVAGEKRACA